MQHVHTCIKLISVIFAFSHADPVCYSGHYDHIELEEGMLCTMTTVCTATDVLCHY